MSQSAVLHGLLVVDKPKGWTSHDVVAKVRGLAGQRQVGHGGTLDPLATGVLPLGLGQGTRLLEYLLGGAKRYLATVQLGSATDTFDADGEVTGRAPWQHITQDTLVRTLTAFTGALLQRPPRYSAIKLHGQPLYRLARRGIAVEAEPRLVTVSRLELVSWAPPQVQLAIDCSSGTYVRSLVHDLGGALRSAAHLVALRRLRAGGLVEEDAVPFADLLAGGRDFLLERLVALDRPIWELPALVVNEERARAIWRGQTVTVSSAIAEPVERCRAYDAHGRFLAILRRGPGRLCWLPHKVFCPPLGDRRPADTGATTDPACNTPTRV